MIAMTLTPSEATDPRRAGGKAAALARLVGEGLPVPPWFVITPDAFHASLSEDQRAAIASATDPDQIREVISTIRPSADMSAAIGQALAALGTSGDTVAVRSSAVDEDGLEHSFAGQLESFLFVTPDMVADRVAHVWRSGFGERVIAYRIERGLRPLPSPPAVLVQRMVDAEVAGVAFGADPVSGRRSVVVVSAVFGLGTALVGGDADCDTFRLDRSNRVIERQIVPKTVRHVRDSAMPEGVRNEPLTDDEGKRATLTDAMAAEVARLVREVSRLSARPQDIEWAIRCGKLYLLQARPITSLGNLPDPEASRAIWDNSNIAESYNGITTPLTFSFARHAYEGVYREFCRMTKVPSRVIADNDAIFSQMLGLIRGRVYYNLLNWYRVLAMLPGFSVNRQFMEQMMGVREGLPDEIARELQTRTWSQRQANRLRLGWSVAGLVGNHFVLPQRIKGFYARLRRSLRDPDPPLEQMRLDQLIAEYRYLERNLLTRWDAPLVNDFLAMIFFGVLGKLVTKWCGPDAASLHNDLISDEGGIISTEPARRITEMARMAGEDRSLVEVLCDAETRTAVAAMSGHPRLHDAYQRYLQDFGDRCLEELKLESPSLVDDPTSLIRSVGHTARRQQQDGEGAGRVAYHPREAAEQRVAEALRSHPLRRIVFRWVLRNARGRIRDRENLRFERTRLFGRMRRIFVQAGQRLFAEGQLDEPRDVFYITLEEIVGFVEGTSVTDTLKEVARLRRAQFEGYRSMAAPADRFETRGSPYIGNPFENAQAAREASGVVGHLKGIGCCPGIVRGRVRVIRDPRGARLRQGEILVAERTDPGWIMLFPAAAGLLVERGSLLSHSAIVAREMGIPAVVSIPNLLASLEDGQWVELDGSVGSIRLIDPPVVTAAALQAETTTV